MSFTHPDVEKKMYADDWQRCIDAVLVWKDDWGTAVVGSGVSVYLTKDKFEFLIQCLECG